MTYPIKYRQHTKPMMPYGYGGLSEWILYIMYGTNSNEWNQWLDNYDSSRLRSDMEEAS